MLAIIMVLALLVPPAIAVWRGWSLPALFATGAVAHAAALAVHLLAIRSEAAPLDPSFAAHDTYYLVSEIRRGLGPVIALAIGAAITLAVSGAGRPPRRAAMLGTFWAGHGALSALVVQLHLVAGLAGMPRRYIEEVPYYDALARGTSFALALAMAAALLFVWQIGRALMRARC